MKKVRLGADLKGDSSAIFDGQVATQALVTEHEASTQRLTLVRFSNGARTKWHTHTFDQVLLGAEGSGIVADEQEELSLDSGEIIIVPAQTIHWHGAKPGTDFAHINIAVPGETSVVRTHGESTEGGKP